MSPVSYQFINSIFRGSRIRNRITVLFQYKYNATKSIGNKGLRVYHKCQFKISKKLNSSRFNRKSILHVYKSEPSIILTH